MAGFRFGIEVVRLVLALETLRFAARSHVAPIWRSATALGASFAQAAIVAALCFRAGGFGRPGSCAAAVVALHAICLA